MKKRNVSLLTALVLALSLALSPVSVFAEDLDTPVYEDPIDEIQSDSDSITEHYSFLSGTTLVMFDVYASCSFEWTEGISGRFTSVYLSAINLTVNTTAYSPTWLTNTEITSYNLGQKAERSFRVPKNNGGYIYITVKVFVDEYGVLSTAAEIL